MFDLDLFLFIRKSLKLTFKTVILVQNYILNLCCSAVNSQSWCKMFVLNLSGIQLQLKY